MAVEAVILGSGTAVPVAERGAAGYLIIADDERMMLDCGPGSTRKLAQAGCQLNDLDRLLISHFHPDHVCDLAALLFGARIPGYQRARPLEIIGPIGLRNHYEKLINLFGDWLISNDYQLKITELDASSTSAAVTTGKNCEISARAVAHSRPAIGYRIKTSAGIIVYSGDTDYCDAIVALCEQAELAILECSSPDEAKINGHLTPGLAGRIAREAGVKHLALSHFYPLCQSADMLAQCRRAYSGRITLAEDLMRFTLA
jgi:ribonuclease BN (tRNA processing enzyme)